MFTRSNKQKIEAQAAEDQGYDCAWLGLDASNPYPVGSVNHIRYEWGYNEGIKHIEEWKEAFFPFWNEYEHWLH